MKLLTPKNLRNLIKPLTYMSIFWIFTDLLPNTKFNGGPVSKLIASFGFFLAYHIGHFLLGFFKLRKNMVARAMMSTATVTGYLVLADKYLADIIDLNPTYVGNTDFIFFKVPVLFQLNDIFSICIFCALILVFCCIIVEVSNKRT